MYFNIYFHSRLLGEKEIKRTTVSRSGLENDFPLKCQFRSVCRTCLLLGCCVEKDPGVESVPRWVSALHVAGGDEGEGLLPWVTVALSDPPEFYYICLNVVAFLGPLLLPAANLGNPLVQWRTLLELQVGYPGLEVLPCWWPSHVIHGDHKSCHLGMTSSSHCNLHINLHSHFLFLFCYKRSVPF